MANLELENKDDASQKIREICVHEWAIDEFNMPTITEHEVHVPVTCENCGTHGYYIYDWVRVTDIEGSDL